MTHHTHTPFPDRILQVGKDSRFDKVKSKPAVFFQYWTIQGVWYVPSPFPILIPYIVVLSS